MSQFWSGILTSTNASTGIVWSNGTLFHVLHSTGALANALDGTTVQVDGTSIVINGANNLAIGTVPVGSISTVVFPVRASDPGGVQNGQAWYNSTTDFVKVEDSLGSLTIGGLLYSIPHTVSTVGGGTSLSTFGAGPTLPVNSLVAGRTFEVKAHGTISTGLLTTSVVLGLVLVSGTSTVTTLATVLPASGIAGSLNGLPWQIDCLFSIQTSGSGGTFASLITLYADNAAVPNISVGLGGGTGSIDTTQTWRVDCGVQFGTSQTGNGASMDTEFVQILA